MEVNIELNLKPAHIYHINKVKPMGLWKHKCLWK